MNRIVKLSVWFLLVSLVFTAQALGQDSPVAFFVAPDGNDAWSGRLLRPNEEGTDGPVATLKAARDAARKVGTERGRMIIVQEGDYYLDESLRLDGRDSGLTITAAAEATVNVYGGQKVTGWVQDGDFFRAHLPGVKEGEWDFRALVVDGRLCSRASLPGGNGKFTHLNEFPVPWMSTTGGGWKRKPTAEELTKMKFKGKDVPGSVEARNAEVRVYHMWDESMVGVAEIDRENNVISFASATSHPAGAFGVKNYKIFNVRAGMTKPGLWYLDRVKGDVVYWPLQREDLIYHEVIAPKVQTVISIEGTREKPVRGISLRGLRISVTTTPLKAGGFGAGGYRGAINVAYAQDCELTELEVSNVAGQGINVRSSQNVSITKNHVHHTGACGVRAPSCVVTDNYIHHVGEIYPSAIGLWGGGNGCVLSHNEIHDTSYTAINCGGKNHRIEYNHIHRAMQKLHDGGGIYCFAGDGTVLRGNLIHDIVDTGGYGASAYYLDERSENCLVEGNLSFGVARPSHNHMALRNTIRNNVFVYEGDMRLTFPKCSEFTFEKNVLYATGKITFSNPEAVTEMNDNIIHSAKGQVIGKKLNNYSEAGDEKLAGGKRNLAVDPKIAEYKSGRVSFRVGTPTARLGIKSIDVSSAGPRE